MRPMVVPREVSLLWVTRVGGKLQLCVQYRGLGIDASPTDRDWFIRCQIPDGTVLTTKEMTLPEVTARVPDEDTVAVFGYFQRGTLGPLGLQVGPGEKTPEGGSLSGYLVVSPQSNGIRMVARLPVKTDILYFDGAKVIWAPWLAHSESPRASVNITEADGKTRVVAPSSGTVDIHTLTRKATGNVTVVTGPDYVVHVLIDGKEVRSVKETEKEMIVLRGGDAPLVGWFNHVMDVKSGQVMHITGDPILCVDRYVISLADDRCTVFVAELQP